MKLFLITLFIAVSFTNLTYSQSSAGVEKQDVYDAKDGRTANWYAVNPYKKSVTLKIKITKSGCDAKTTTEIEEIYVSANDKSRITNTYDKSYCFGSKTNYRTCTVKVLSKKFN